MNAKQEAKLNMYRATQKHCNDNPQIVEEIPAFKNNVNTFNILVSSIIATAQQEDLIIKGITLDKADAKKILCRLAADVAAQIVAYAAATKNNKLLKEVNFSHSQLVRTKDDVLTPRCQNIMDAVRANMAQLADYGISDATIDSLDKAISDYQNRVPDPRNAAAQRTTARANLKSLLKEADNILKLQMDKTVLAFNATHPDFVNTYKTNRIIIDPSKTTTSLKGVITNLYDDSFIKGATVTFQDAADLTKAFNAVTNELGEFEIKPIAAGIYDVKVTAPKFQDLLKEKFTVKLGQISRVNFSITAIAK